MTLGSDAKARRPTGRNLEEADGSGDGCALQAADAEAAVPLMTWEGLSVEHWRREWRVPDLRFFDVIGSTNDLLRSLAESGAPEGTTVLAEAQLAGRGRGGRRWEAPRGEALLMSVLIRPRGTAERIAPGAIPLRVGLAVARAAEALTGRPVGLKWPNDVVFEGRGKVAGILCEGSLGATSAFVVAGIGVNVNQRRSDFPEELVETATSLRISTDREISRAELAGAILRELHQATRRGSEPLGSDEVAAIGDRDVLRNRPITVDGVPRGIAVGITAEGVLMVREADGRITPVHSGTVRAITREEPGKRETYP